MLGQQLAALLAVGVGEPEPLAEPGEQLPQLVRAAVLESPNDVVQLESGLLVLGPFGQEPADFAVQVLLESTAW